MIRHHCSSVVSFQALTMTISNHQELLDAGYSINPQPSDKGHVKVGEEQWLQVTAKSPLTKPLMVESDLNLTQIQVKYSSVAGSYVCVCIVHAVIV